MMSRVVLVVAVVCLATLCAAEDPDVGRTGPQLITSKGLPCEEHWVETPDNFVLELIRIPRPGAPVAFLQHGFLDSADTWLVNSRDSSLAYIMYDAGFDVWMGNSRGNKYSRNNTKYSPNWPFDAKFWAWDWDEMAKYDMPTQINYALKVSGKDKVVYVGHSQGTTQAFANFATPESGWENMADKISVFVALAPVAYVYHTGSVLIKALADLDIDKLVAFLGVHEFLPTSTLLRWLLPTLCDATPLLCESVIYLFAGLDLGDLDKNRLDVYTAHFPSGTSVQDTEHWAQAARYNKYQMYDFGLIGNLEHYKSDKVPQYDLTGIRAPPTALFYGGKDDLADPTDVIHLMNLVPSHFIVNTTYYPQYGHLDFVWGQHANTTIYNKVVTLAKQFS